jgi:hypothetical protein
LYWIENLVLDYKGCGGVIVVIIEEENFLNPPSVAVASYSSVVCDRLNINSQNPCYVLRSNTQAALLSPLITPRRPCRSRLDFLPSMFFVPTSLTGLLCTFVNFFLLAFYAPFFVNFFLAVFCRVYIFPSTTNSK